MPPLPPLLRLRRLARNERVVRVQASADPVEQARASPCRPPSTERQSKLEASAPPPELLLRLTLVPLLTLRSMRKWTRHLQVPLPHLLTPANPVNPAAPATPDAPATDGSSLAAPAAANAAAAGSTGASPGSEMSAGEAAVAIALEQAKGSAGMPLLGQNASDTTTTSTCTKIWTRKEYSTMTVEEKTQFANAFKCVRSKPSRFKSDPGWNAADDWTLLHIRMVKYVHFSAFFLVFHRASPRLSSGTCRNAGFSLDCHGWIGR